MKKRSRDGSGCGDRLTATAAVSVRLAAGYTLSTSPIVSPRPLGAIPLSGLPQEEVQAASPVPGGDAAWSGLCSRDGDVDDVVLCVSRAFPLLDGTVVVASGCNNGTVYLHAVADGRRVVAMHGHCDSVTAVSRTALRDGSCLLLASASSDCSVRVWDVTTGQCLHVLNSHVDGVMAVSSVFVGSGGRLAVLSGSADYTLCVWDVAAAAVVHDIDMHASIVYSVSDAYYDVHRDAVVFASASLDGTVRLWDVASGDCLAVLCPAGDDVVPVLAVTCGFLLPACSHMCVACACADGVVRVVDTATGVCVRAMAGHGGTVLSVSDVVPDGRGGLVLASASDDRTIRTWDVVSGTGVDVVSVSALAGQASTIIARCVSLSCIERLEGASAGVAHPIRVTAAPLSEGMPVPTLASAAAGASAGAPLSALSAPAPPAARARPFLPTLIAGIDCAIVALHKE